MIGKQYLRIRVCSIALMLALYFISGGLSNAHDIAIVTLAAIFTHQYPVAGHQVALQGVGSGYRGAGRLPCGSVLFDEVQVFHRPHPQPITDKGAVASVRRRLEFHGVIP